LVDFVTHLRNIIVRRRLTGRIMTTANADVHRRTYTTVSGAPELAMATVAMAMGLLRGYARTGC
jgi:hypothetical protein